MIQAQPRTSRGASGQRRDRGLLVILGGLLLLGLGLRLLVWRWHEQYPLGGDEREYFEQALGWLQGKGYRELPLMRPPLYTVFLAVVFQLFDSQVQRVRLVQALISTGTIGLMWLWVRAALGSHQRWVALATTALTALCFTLAASATELLTETLFTVGLTLVFWLLARTAGTLGDTGANRPVWCWAVLAGLTVGLLSLVRSVALPLVPLGAVWLLLPQGRPCLKLRWRQAIWFGLGAVLVIFPWTLRNYALYATPIIIDTTGAENLWLDNAVTDRETVKRQLYAMGDDRGGRQQVAMAEGLAAISAAPGRFAAKAWREAKAFVALEYFDDLQRRPAIWVSPLEVWLRMLLGDGIWLLVLWGGIAGLWLYPRSHLKWLLVPWVLYVFVTGLVFHVELRYRLPLYPALLPFAGWSLVRGIGWLSRRPRSAVAFWRVAGAVSTLVAVAALMLLHRPYPADAVRLLRKHYHLAQAHRIAARSPLTEAAVAQGQAHAAKALALDAESALARVELGRLAVPVQAVEWWQAAVDVLPAHPYAHLLLGNALRQRGDEAEARRELDFESRSLEDLQSWALNVFDMEPQPVVDVGAGLDLGLVTGFYLAADNVRWTGNTGRVHRLAPGAEVAVRLRSPRPPGASPAAVRVLLNDTLLGTLMVGSDWQTYQLEVPEQLRATALPWTVRLETTTFRPRAFDRANGDNRALGVQVDWITTDRTLIQP